MKILHISDTHAESKTLERLGELIPKRDDCTVVALTGDCSSTYNDQVPKSWNLWPQGLKLAVKGNHIDNSRTFQHLTNWWHATPLKYQLKDVLFVGLDSFSEERTLKYLEGMKCAYESVTDAVVLLSHCPPLIWEENRFAIAIDNLVGNRVLLSLHGHEHPDGFRGSEWATEKMFNGKVYDRSNVCSSTSNKEGMVHCIEWKNGSFKYEVLL